MEVDKLKKFYEDILLSITNIESSTAGLEPDHYNNYEVSWIVERGIEIIAEALKRLVSSDPDVKITNVTKIIATRNKITHEYDVIDKYQLFVIVTKYLPILKAEVRKLLE